MEHPTCLKCDLSIFCFYTKKFGIEPKQRHLKRNEMLHLADATFSNLYGIQRGALKTYEVDNAGNELIRGFYFKNEVYGYEAIYKGYYLFSAVALSETVLCEISYQNFLELLRSEPELLTRILYLMSQQLTVGSYLKFITAQQKLSSFLLDLSTRLSANGFYSNFMLPMSYQDMGNYLGLATETVARILSKFKQRKILSIEKKHMYFLDVNGPVPRS